MATKKMSFSKVQLNVHCDLVQAAASLFSDVRKRCACGIEVNYSAVFLRSQHDGSAYDQQAVIFCSPEPQGCVLGSSDFHKVAEQSHNSVGFLTHFSACRYTEVNHLLHYLIFHLQLSPAEGCNSPLCVQGCVCRRGTDISKSNVGHWIKQQLVFLGH